MRPTTGAGPASPPLGQRPPSCGRGATARQRWVWLTSVSQLISDAGYQGEITSVSTACQQLEVFSRVLRTSLATILDGGEENLEKNLPEFAVSASLDVAQLRRRPFAWGRALYWGECLGPRAPSQLGTSPCTTVGVGLFCLPLSSLWS